MSLLLHESCPPRTSMRHGLRPAKLAASLAVVGCTVGPDDVRPRAPDAAASREAPLVDDASKDARL